MDCVRATASKSTADSSPPSLNTASSPSREPDSDTRKPFTETNTLRKQIGSKRALDRGRVLRRGSVVAKPSGPRPVPAVLSVFVAQYQAHMDSNSEKNIGASIHTLTSTGGRTNRIDDRGPVKFARQTRIACNKKTQCMQIWNAHTTTAHLTSFCCQMMQCHNLRGFQTVFGSFCQPTGGTCYVTCALNIRSTNGNPKTQHLSPMAYTPSLCRDVPVGSPAGGRVATRLRKLGSKDVDSRSRSASTSVSVSTAKLELCASATARSAKFSGNMNGFARSMAGDNLSAASCEVANTTQSRHHWKHLARTQRYQQGIQAVHTLP
jgi:hypothetical protein